jgi:hypothetical protein
MMPLCFKLGNEKESTIARPFEIAYFQEAVLPVQLVEPEESRDSYLVKVCEFWSQLELFLAIYMKYNPEGLVSTETFMGFFSNLRYGE